jgi:hypothetical protein
MGPKLDFSGYKIIDPSLKKLWELIILNKFNSISFFKNFELILDIKICTNISRLSLSRNRSITICNFFYQFPHMFRGLS